MNEISPRPARKPGDDMRFPLGIDEAGVGHVLRVDTDGRLELVIASVIENELDWLYVTNTPTTLAGYGITDAAPLVHVHAWGDITSGKPTTLAGYGITDAAPLVHVHAWGDITSGIPTTLSGYGITDAVDGSGTANYVPYWVDLNTLGPSGLYWDAVNGRAGLGTDTPGHRLHIIGSGAVQSIKVDNTGTVGGAELQLSRGANYRTCVIRHQLSGTVEWAVGLLYNGGVAQTRWGVATSSNLSDAKLVIDTSGNVGVNELSPDYLLDVNGAIGFAPGSSVTPVDNGDVVFEATDNTTFTIKLRGSDGTVRSGTVTLA